MSQVHEEVEQLKRFLAAAVFVDKIKLAGLFIC